MQEFCNHVVLSLDSFDYFHTNYILITALVAENRSLSDLCVGENGISLSVFVRHKKGGRSYIIIRWSPIAGGEACV